MNTKKGSILEATLAWQIEIAGLPTPAREYRPFTERRFRWDFAFVDQKLLVEVQGGIWTGGRHGRGAGIEADMEKLNLATINGWRVLQVSGKHIDNGKALMWIRRALSV